MSEIIMEVGEQSNTEENIPSSKFQSLNSNWEVIVIIVLSVFTTFLLVDAFFRKPILIPSPGETNLTEQETDLPVCHTKDCLLTAYTFLQNMNESVDPCEDFFMFSCGGYINSKDTKNNEDISFTPIRALVAERLKLLLEEIDNSSGPAKTLYKACINQATQLIGWKDRGSVLLKVLKDLKLEWPVISNFKYDQSKHPLWNERIYKIKEFGLNGDYLMDISIQETIKNTKFREILIVPPEFGLNRAYLVNGNKDPNVEEYYEAQQHIADDLIFLEYAYPNYEHLRTFIESDASKVLNFEMKLANAKLPDEETLCYQNKILKLEVDYKHIPWLNYINTMLSIGKSTDRITSNSTVTICDPKYFEKLNKLLQYENKETIANYIMWRTVNDINKLLKHGTGCLGWKSCVLEVSTKFPSIVGSMYIQRYYDETIEDNVLEMNTYIRNEILKTINQTDWLDSDTKEKVYKNTESITTYIGSLGVSAIDSKQFDEMVLNETNYVQSILNYNKFQFNFDLTTEEISSRNPTDVNAYYYRKDNSVEIPGALLQGFIYKNIRPMYINYGVAGWIVGHENAHSLDDDGAAWNLESFQNRSKCLVGQYGNYTVPAVGLNVNGASTLGENISDNLGIIAAYKAYQSWALENGKEKRLPGLNYTVNQLFWISAANLRCKKESTAYLKRIMLTDEHSLNRFRVLGSFSNSVEFGKDFNCPVGSKMNPVNKCKVYGQ